MSIFNSVCQFLTLHRHTGINCLPQKLGIWLCRSCRANCYLFCGLWFEAMEGSSHRSLRLVHALSFSFSSSSLDFAQGKTAHDPVVLNYPHEPWKNKGWVRSERRVLNPIREQKGIHWKLLSSESKNFGMLLKVLSYRLQPSPANFLTIQE